MSTLLDVAIGLIFVYVFFSMIASGITEWISRLFEMRAKVLKSAVQELLGSAADGKLAEFFYKHPLIKGISDKSPNGPTYIPSAHFALALMDLVIEFPAGSNAAAKPKVDGTTHDLKTDESDLVNSVIQGLNSETAVQARIEKWFNDSMERVSGIYKRKTYWMLLAASLAISIGLGVDTIRITKALYNNNSLRQAAVAAAEKAIDKSADPTKADITIAGLDLPLGWQNRDEYFYLGCLLTTFALTLGSPFWFDLLGKLVNLRHTGAPPEKKS